MSLYAVATTTIATGLSKFMIGVASVASGLLLAEGGGEESSWKAIRYKI